MSDRIGRSPQSQFQCQKAGRTSLSDKCLVQIPSRFAIEMCRRGWTSRNEIIWHKPNCVPSSFRDRFTVDFEKVFLFVKSRKYFFDGDAVRDAHAEDKRREGLRRARAYGYDGKVSYQDWYFNIRKKTDWVGGMKTLTMGMHATRGLGRNKPPLIHPLGRSRRCVWSIPNRPLIGAHFASYPSALVEIPIKAGSPAGGIVLDPFIGSGTTALVALELGRKFIGIELKPEYVRMARERIEHWQRQQKSAA